MYRALTLGPTCTLGEGWGSLSERHEMGSPTGIWVVILPQGGLRLPAPVREVAFRREDSRWIPREAVV